MWRPVKARRTVSADWIENTFIIWSLLYGFGVLAIFLAIIGDRTWNFCSLTPAAHFTTRPYNWFINWVYAANILFLQLGHICLSMLGSAAFSIVYFGVNISRYSVPTSRQYEPGRLFAYFHLGIVLYNTKVIRSDRHQARLLFYCNLFLSVYLYWFIRLSSRFSQIWITVVKLDRFQVGRYSQSVDKKERRFDSWVDWFIAELGYIIYYNEYSSHTTGDGEHSSRFNCLRGAQEVSEKPISVPYNSDSLERIFSSNSMQIICAQSACMHNKIFITMNGMPVASQRNLTSSTRINHYSELSSVKMIDTNETSS